MALIKVSILLVMGTIVATVSSVPVATQQALPSHPKQCLQNIPNPIESSRLVFDRVETALREKKLDFARTKRMLRQLPNIFERMMKHTSRQFSKCLHSPIGEKGARIVPKELNRVFKRLVNRLNDQLNDQLKSLNGKFPPSDALKTIKNVRKEVLSDVQLALEGILPKVFPPTDLDRDRDDIATMRRTVLRPRT